MKIDNFAKAVTVVAIAGIVGLAATSFAGWGRGGGGNCLGQKRIDHRIKMQKENPEFFADRGYGRGGRGMARGFNGQGMGRGFCSQDGCGY